MNFKQLCFASVALSLKFIIFQVCRSHCSLKFDHLIITRKYVNLFLVPIFECLFSQEQTVCFMLCPCLKCFTVLPKKPPSFNFEHVYFLFSFPDNFLADETMEKCDET